MCGIAGIFHFDQRPIVINQLRTMADILKHRGPDDEGFALFNTTTEAASHFKGPDSPVGVTLPDIRSVDPAHVANLGLMERRLAILDLSPAGHTPMTLPEFGLTIAFNGEIYNYVELRDELCALGYSFHTRGDTEVLLTAYHHWGPECVARFNGMWAFALWDAARHRLFCSRDRFGVKPFYYIHSRTLFAFASEPKALWKSGLITAKPNPPLLLDFLAGYEASQLDQTLFENIHQLPGGQNLVIDQERITTTPYWSLPCNPDLGPAMPESAPAQHLRELLTDAVRLRLRSDVPIGTCLSGGLDSSAIVVITSNLMQSEHNLPRALVGQHQKTFTAAYEDVASDERAFAQLIVNQTGAEWHQTFPTAEALQADLDRFIWHHDEPPITTSIYAQWCVMRLARQHGVTVTLDGQGSDELLGGYLPFDVQLAHLWQAGQWRRLVSEAQGVARVGSRSLSETLIRAAAYQLPPNLQQYLQHQRPGRWLGLRREVAEAAIVRHHHAFAAEHQTNLPRHLRALTQHNLPRLLRSEDRNSMAFSVEARTPFLDVRLAEYISQLPAVYRVHNGWTKYILRQAITGLVPEAIAWRRDKKGFATPERAWLRILHPRLNTLFHDSPRAKPYLDMPRVHAILRNTDYTRSGMSSAAVWRWAATELWLRMLER